MTKTYIISSKSESGFWRCGCHFTQDGVTVKEDDFKPEQWDRLWAEPMLNIKQLDGTAKGNELVLHLERQKQISAAIKKLDADGFQKDHKPKVASLNELLGDDSAKITAKERDEAWENLLESHDGFEIPTADGPRHINHDGTVSEPVVD